MNNCYKVIWNEATGTTVAVAETAKGKGAQAVGSSKPGDHRAQTTFTHFFIKPLVAALICIGFSFATYAAPSTSTLTAPVTTQLPTGAQVSAGTATVSQSGAALTVKQTSTHAALNWQTFNVGSQASVNFEQPTSQSVTLNRVLDSNPSQIFGKISANGAVFLQNPNGVYFAPGSSVDVGSLVATTHSISDTDFMSGNYSFSRTGSTGKILNQGTLTSKLGGYIALLAPEVQNQGVVIAKGGTIVLAAGETFQLQFEANQTLTNILVSPSTVAAYVENGNAVMAPGGLVILSAQAANAIQGGVVKNTGSIQADGLVNDGGVIRLVASHSISNTGTITADAMPGGTGSGGQITLIADLTNPSSTIHIDGTLSAQGAELGGNGGQIETSGSHVRIADGARISTEAPKGTGGSWTIDPTDFIVGTGGDISGATLGTNLTSNNVTILSSSGATGTSGNININDAVSWSGNKKLTLSADNNININTAINVPTGGSVSLVYGTGTATGDYNFGSFSANNTQFTGSINFAGTGAGLFTTQLGTGSILSYTVINNPSTYVLATNPTGGINSSSGNFALAQNYNFDRTFTASPITGTFTGKFEGLGHTVGNLTGTGAIGLFNNSSGLIRDVGVNMSTSNAANGTGGLANTNSGTILNSFANVAIVSNNTYTTGTFGGLVGNNSGPVSNSFSMGSITGGSNLGGLIGINTSSSNLLPSDILNSFSTASIVSGASAGVIGGGLIAENKTSGVGGSAKIINSFATGNVSGFVNAGTGGLVGYNHTGAANSFVSISNSYSTGTIFGPTVNGAQNYSFGGLVGLNRAQGTGTDASITNSYTTGDVNAAGSGVGGLVGTNQALSASSSVKVTGSYATGAVNTYSNGTTNGNSQSIGGLIGANSAAGASAIATVTQSYATGAVNGAAGTGGLIGYNYATAGGDTSVNLSYATGYVKGNNSNAAGLIGNNSTAGNTAASKSTVTDSYATGNVSVVDGITATSAQGTWGGLIGNNTAINFTLGDVSVSNSYASGNVAAVGGNLGGLIGNNQSTGKATVTNSYATGNVTSSGGGAVGGLIGQNISNLPADSSSSGNLTVSNSYASGNVSGTTNIGGLIGNNSVSGTYGIANVTNSYAGGNVSGTTSNVGGLIGSNAISAVGGSATVTSSYSFNPGNAITVQGTSNVGGLIGYNYANAQNSTISISNSYASASVIGSSSYVGGLIGNNIANALGSNSTSTNNYAIGNVSGTSNVGGLMGANIANSGGNATITTSYATGNVTGTNSNVGGLVGVNSSNNSGTSSSTNISNSYATGNVTDTYTSFSYVGGLVGQNYTGGTGNSSVISQSYASGSVTSSGIDVGGLIGYNVGNGNANISQSYALGNVSSSSNTAYNLGGLVGYNLAGASGSDVSISMSYANGSVTAPGNAAGGFGGLVGQISASSGAANIEKSYSTGSVQISNTGVIYAGGFVGMVPTSLAGSSVNISNSYATGNVQGASGNYLGGFMGEFLSATRGSISNSYATGAVSGSTHLGGFLGAIGASTNFQNNFWNTTNNSGLSAVSGGVGDKLVATSGITGLTTTSMQDLSNFSGWDTNSVWQSLSYFNNQLPFLRQNNTLATITLVSGSSVYGDTPVLSYAITNSFGNAITSPTASGTPVWALSQNGSFIGNQSISSTTNAGTYSLTYNSGISLGNYTIVSGTASNWTVGKAALGLSVTGTYSGTTSITPTSYTVTGLKNNETMVPTAVTLSDANVATANKYVTAITANTGNANFNNYDVATSFNATPNTTSTNTATLNPIALSVSAVASLSGNPYKGSAYTGTYTSSAMVPADANLISVSGVATGTDAGTYTSSLAVSLSGSALTNYSTPAITNANLVVSPKTITITNTAWTTPYDAVTAYSSLANQTLYTNTALVGSDAINTLTQTANKTGVAQAGSYSVTPGAASLASGNPNNYLFSYISANNTVSPVSLTVANSTVASKVYDGTTAASVTNGSLQGVLAADASLVGLNQLGVFANPNVGANIGLTLSDTLTGAAAANYTLTQPTGLTASITPKSLTVTGQTGVNKVYDATTTATLTGGSLNGVVGSEAVGLVQTGTFASPNAGTGIAITASNTLSGATSGNYQITQPTTLSANITPAILTVEGLSASAKVYDGTTTASLSGMAVAKPLGGGQVTINGSPVGTYQDKNVGANKYIDVTGFTLSGADAGNYQVTGLHGVYGDITPASLSITGLTANSKVYDATTAATFTGGAITGLMLNDVVNVNSGFFNNKNVGTGKAVTAVLTGADAGNYVATGLTGFSANVTPASLSISGQTAANKVYDSTMSATLNSGTLVGVFNGDAVTLTQAGAFTDKNVGIAKSIVGSSALGGVDAANYVVVQPTNLAANITPATLAVSGLSASNKVYNAATDATLTGAPVTTPLGNDVVTLTGTVTGAFLDKNVGNGKSVLVAGLAINTALGDGANYVLPTDMGLTANISKKDLTITGTTVANKVYDATTTATLSNATLVGVEGSDVLTLAQTGTFSDKNVGTGKSVTPSSSLLGAANGNYNVIEPTGLTGTITKAPLSVTGLSVSEKFYDGTTSASIAGNPVAHPLLTDDVSVSGLPSAVFSSPNAGLNVPVTVSNLTLAGADAGNYSASAITGVAATIKPAVLTAVANPYSKVYDGTAAATPTMTITAGLVGTETLNVASTGFFDAKDVLTASMVTVNATTLSNGSNGGLASNYSLSAGQTATATITPAQLTASVMAPNKVYDGTVAATHTLNITSGLVGSETLDVASTASFNSKNVATANLVTVNTASLSDGNNGGLASNYSLSPGQTVVANITPAPLTAAVTAPNKVYDGTVTATPSMTITSGLVGTETLNVAGTASFNTKNVATANLVTVETASLTDGSNGGLASNYSLSTGQTVAANITPAPLTASVTAPNKVYDGTVTATANLVITSGLIGTETLNSAGTASFNSKNVTTANLVTVDATSLTDGSNGGLASNYSLSPGQTVAASITPAQLTASVTAPNKVYDGTVKASPILRITSGLVGFETLDVASTASFNSKNVATANLVTVDTALLSDGSNGGLASNYSLSPGQTVAANIIPAPLTAAVTAPNKVYDGTVTATPTLAITAGLVGAETLNVAGTASFNTKNVTTAKWVTVSTANLSDGSHGGLASNYSLSPGQTVTANITPALLTATDIAPVTATYGDPITPGAVQLAGVIGSDKVSATANLANAKYSSSNNVKAGAYQQTVHALAGLDASNYTLAPFTTNSPNYEISALALNGAITSSSTTAGALLAPGTVSFKNVVAGDVIGVAEVVVAIPGAAKGSKTGNTVGTFVGSQKVASLSGVDAENYSYQNVLGDYTVKTGFSSGSILPPEMRSVSNQTSVLKESSTSAFVSPLKTSMDKAESATLSGKVATDTKVSQPSEAKTPSSDITPTQAKTKEATQTEGKKLAQTQTQTQTQKQTKAPSPSTVSQVLATAKVPLIASALAGNSLDFSNLGTVPDAQGESTSQSTPAPAAQETYASIESNDSLEASIYEFVGEVLRSPTTYQVLGGASSLAVLSKALLSSATSVNLVNAPTNTPNHAPSRGPYEPASNANNRLSNRLSRRV